MGELAPPLAAETEALREAYPALNRNDVPAMVEAFDPQIERGASTYHGQIEAMAHLSQARGSWAEGSCEPERLIVVSDKAADDKIIVFVRVRVRL